MSRKHHASPRGRGGNTRGPVAENASRRGADSKRAGNRRDEIPRIEPDDLPDPDRYFDIQSIWLGLEAEAERERMAARREVQSRDKAEQRGETLLRMQIESSQTGLGGRLLLTLVKPGGTALPMTKLRVGSPVVLSDDRDFSDRGVAGVVSRRKSHLIEVATEVYPEADWLRIDLSPDETTRLRQEAAMANMRVAHGRTAKLRDMFIGTREIGSPGPRWSVPDAETRLNPPQIDAATFALASPDIAIIHGPPGTGKTTTLVEVICAAVEAGEKVLATAPSNTAVDNLLEPLSHRLRDVVRLGHPARVFEHLRDRTLDQMVEDDPSSAVIRDMRRELEEILRDAAREHRGRDARRRRGELYAEAGRLRGQIRGLERSIVRGILDSADVICTTTTVDEDLLGDRQFDRVVIDEACQCTLPGVWQAVSRGDRIIMAGDHLQLPPTVLSKPAAIAGLEKSPMQRLVEQNGESIYRRLTVQYRMHEQIMRFPSDHFYDGDLVADHSVRHHRLTDLPAVDAGVWTEPTATFIDTAGGGYEEHVEKEGLSKFNPKEATFVVNVLGELLRSGVRDKDIGVIAPYGAQVRMLRNRVDRRGIEIDTVDGFQGREKEVIVLSMVRSNEIGEIGFLSETRRTNVALTRARRRLIVVGDSGTIGRHPFYAAMLEYFESIGGYRSVFEFES